MDISPLSLAVREFLTKANADIVEIAAQIGMKRTTLQSRLTRQHPLNMLSGKDIEIVRRVATALGVEPLEILERAREIASGDRASVGPDQDMVNVLLDTLENAQTTPDTREKARRALLRIIYPDFL